VPPVPVICWWVRQTSRLTTSGMRIRKLPGRKSPEQREHVSGRSMRRAGRGPSTSGTSYSAQDGGSLPRMLEWLAVPVLFCGDRMERAILGRAGRGDCDGRGRGRLSTAAGLPPSIVRPAVAWKHRERVIPLHHPDPRSIAARSHPAVILPAPSPRVSPDFPPQSDNCRDRMTSPPGWRRPRSDGVRGKSETFGLRWGLRTWFRPSLVPRPGRSAGRGDFTRASLNASLSTDDLAGLEFMTQRVALLIPSASRSPR
jgi:hypothetical protein